MFASPVSGYLLRYAADAGYRTLLVEPDAARADAAKMAGFPVLPAVPDDIEGADVVVTDHHRDELGVALRDALAAKARWVGIMGNPHHAGPHVAALESLGVAPGEIAKVHRPIGLNIGSRTPPEIAISTLAGLHRRPQLPPRRLLLLRPQPGHPERTRSSPFPRMTRGGGGAAPRRCHSRG